MFTQQNEQRLRWQYRHPPLQKAQGWGTHRFTMGMEIKTAESLGHPPRRVARSEYLRAVRCVVPGRDPRFWL